MPAGSMHTYSGCDQPSMAGGLSQAHMPCSTPKGPGIPHGGTLVSVWSQSQVLLDTDMQQGMGQGCPKARCMDADETESPETWMPEIWMPCENACSIWE